MRGGRLILMAAGCYDMRICEGRQVPSQFANQKRPLSRWTGAAFRLPSFNSVHVLRDTKTSHLHPNVPLSSLGRFSSFLTIQIFLVVKAKRTKKQPYLRK